MLQGILSATCTVVTIVIPVVWIAVQALVLMNLALAAATAHRRATIFQLLCAVVVGVHGLEFASTELLATPIYVLMLPVLAGTALSFVTSHAVWQGRQVGAALFAAGATAWDTDPEGKVLSVLGAPLADLGCPTAQGYFIARPAPFADLLTSDLDRLGLAAR